MGEGEYIYSMYETLCTLVDREVSGGEVYVCARGGMYVWNISTI